MKKGLIIAAVLLILVAAVVVLVACPKKDNHDTSETPESSADVSDEVSKEVEETSDVIDTSEPDISQEDTSEADASEEPDASEPPEGETSENEETSKDDVLENTTATYTVKHWKQNVDGNAAAHDSTNYTLAYTETGEGEIGSYAVPKVKNYAGFTAPVLQEMEIVKTGTTINYYYTRNLYTVTVVAGEGISSVSGSGNYLFGSTATISATVADGYKWNGWVGGDWGNEISHSFTVGAFNTTCTANADKVVAQQPDVSNPTEESKDEPSNGEETETKSELVVVVGGEEKKANSLEETKELFSAEALAAMPKGATVTVAFNNNITNTYVSNGDGTFDIDGETLTASLIANLMKIQWCPVCGLRNGQGNGQCVQFLIETDCDVCGEHCQANTCHTHYLDD